MWTRNSCSYFAAMRGTRSRMKLSLKTGEQRHRRSQDLKHHLATEPATLEGPHLHPSHLCSTYGQYISLSRLKLVGEWHWNMYNIIYEIDDQSKFDAWNTARKASALGQPRGMGWGGECEGGLGRGGHMFTRGWFMSMYGKNHHNIVKITSFQLNKLIF